MKNSFLLVALSCLIFSARTSRADTPPANGAAAICAAAKDGNAALVKSLLAEASLANAECAVQQSVFYWTMTTGNPIETKDEIGEALALAGSAPNYLNVRRGSWGRRSEQTNFELANTWALPKTLRAYLARGANPNVGSTAERPLAELIQSSYGSEESRVALIDLMLKSGATPTYLQGNYSLPALVIMRHYSEETQLRFLSDWNFATDSLTINDLMVVNLRAQHSLKITNFLVSKGANLNSLNLGTRLDNQLTSALSVALETGRVVADWQESNSKNTEFLSYLVNSVADINADNGAAVRFATYFPFWVLKDIGSRHPNVNLAQNQPNIQPALVEQVDYRSQDPDLLQRVEYLVGLGASVNQIDYFGTTPLMAAARDSADLYDVANFLISKGASVNQRDHSGATALCYATYAPKVTALLKKHGGVLGKCNN